MHIKSLILAVVAVAGLAAATLASSSIAEAGFNHRGFGAQRAFKPIGQLKVKPAPGPTVKPGPFGPFVRPGHIGRPPINVVLVRPSHHHHHQTLTRYVPRPVYVQPAPVYQPAPVVQQVAAPAANCLSKQYTQDGQVVFIDSCTNEQVAAPIAEAQQK